MLDLMCLILAEINVDVMLCFDVITMKVNISKILWSMMA